MALKNDLYIGNTDHEWFDFCSARPNLREVNFWQPSRQHFKALTEGGIFFFRRKSPINLIGGFGILASSNTASIGMLWDDLRESNGVPDEETFIKIVKNYNRQKLVDRSTQVGFKIIIDQVFLKKDDWFELPGDWSPNIVSGKSYSSTSLSGAYLLRKYRELSNKYYDKNSKYTLPSGFTEPEIIGGYGSSLVKVRLGQSAFRLAVLAAYNNSCAVTGCEVSDILDAAHIIPFNQEQSHSVTNGICLRKDIHTLFDRRLVFFDRNYKFQITDRFRELYPKEKSYDSYVGRTLSLPSKRKHWPALFATKPS